MSKISADIDKQDAKVVHGIRLPDHFHFVKYLVDTFRFQDVLNLYPTVHWPNQRMNNFAMM